MLEWVGLLAVLAVGGGPVGRGDVPGRELALEVQGERLGLRARDVPAAEVLEAFTKATGAALRGQQAPRTRVTLTFDPIPIPEALQRVLGDRSFVLRYGEGGRLLAVELAGGPAAPGLPQLRPAGAPPGADLLAAAEAHGLVAVDGKLATLLGADRVTFVQLADTALRDSDADVRAQAMAAGLRALEDDPALGRALEAALDGADAAATGETLRTVAGARAEELAAYVATRATRPGLRTRAGRVLRSLRGRGADG